MTELDANPPRWAERAVRLLLKPSDRESIPGDLLEEYREVIRPRFGRVRADVWYLTQVLSFVTSRQLGLALGVVSSLAIVLTSIVFPLTGIRIPDSGAINAVSFGSAFFLWGVAGFAAGRRTGDVGASIKAGAVVALVNMLAVMLTFVLINNLFLDIVSQEPEKIWGLEHSSYHSMRAYLNYIAARGLLLALPVFVAFGALSGAIGGAIGRVGKRRIAP